MKAFSWFMMRFPRMGLEWVQNEVQNGSRMSSRMTLRTIPQTGPEMPSDPPYPGLRYPYAQNKAFIDVLLTVAERI